MTLNGSAVNTDDSRLQLTTGGSVQAGSAFSNSRVNVQSFATDFTFQLSGSVPIADGITFTIQGVAVNVGPPTDEYKAEPVGANFDLGPIAINSAGNHTFKFTVVGRNPLSSGWKISFDYLEFDAR